MKGKELAGSIECRVSSNKECLSLQLSASRVTKYLIPYMNISTEMKKKQGSQPFAQARTPELMKNTEKKAKE